MSYREQDPAAIDRHRLFFFLGGHDLEMAVIAELLAAHAPARFLDKGLSWDNALASAYRQEVADVQSRGLTPVLIELRDDLDLAPDAAILVDHHAERAGADQPTSLEQVFALLALPRTAWTRWYELVAANDRGHIRALRRAGASNAEIREVREADWRAQGVSRTEVTAVRAALAQRREQPHLTVVGLPHERSSLAADLLDSAWSGPGWENLLVVCPCHFLFQGEGRIIVELEAAFSGGWRGGELPERGYWGHSARGLASAAVEGLISRLLR